MLGLSGGGWIVSSCVMNVEEAAVPETPLKAVNRKRTPPHSHVEPMVVSGSNQGPMGRPRVTSLNHTRRVFV